MDTIYLNDFSENGIIIEKSFRKKVEAINWEKYKNKKVLIKGCADFPVPTWSYLIIASELSQYADYVYYGEPCSLIKIYNK